MTREIILKLILFLLLQFFAACSELFRPPLGPGESLVDGYSTRCRSSVMLQGETGEQTSSLIAPAGRQSLLVMAASELESPPLYDSGGEYYCRYHSQHRIEFLAQERKIYRLHLEERGEGRYRVSVWEGIDEKGIITRPVDTLSQQLSIRRECRFFPMCDPLLGG